MATLQINEVIKKSFKEADWETAVELTTWSYHTVTWQVQIEDVQFSFADEYCKRSSHFYEENEELGCHGPGLIEEPGTQKTTHATKVSCCDKLFRHVDFLPPNLEKEFLEIFEGITADNLKQGECLQIKLSLEAQLFLAKVRFLEKLDHIFYINDPNYHSPWDLFSA